MSIMMSEEFITLAGSNDYKIFTKKFQRKERNLYSVNLIIIHGGPGINTHKELVDVFVPSIFEKTDVGSVLFYDQLGCGSSDKPNDTSQYSISAFVHHLSLIINGMSQVVLFGYSFGGQLVMEWLCTAFTSNVVGVIISNSPLDQVTYGLKQEKLRMELDLDLQTFYDQEENIKIVTKTVKQIQVVREKGQEIITYVDKEVVKDREVVKFVENCPIPEIIISTHNAAALNKIIEDKK